MARLEVKSQIYKLQRNFDSHFLISITEAVSLVLSLCCLPLLLSWSSMCWAGLVVKHGCSQEELERQVWISAEHPEVQGGSLFLGHSGEIMAGKTN